MNPSPESWLKLVDTIATIGVLVFFIRYFMAELKRREDRFFVEIEKRDAVIRLIEERFFDELEKRDVVIRELSASVRSLANEIQGVKKP